MGNKQLATVEQATEQQLMEQVVVKGNIAGLTPAQRVDYYKMRCDAAGLDWRTSPLMYVTLQGKLTLYATKNCAEQLQQTRGISVTLLGDDFMANDTLYRVKARAETTDGRHTDNMGVVSMVKGENWLAGEDLANAILKAVTKAERRAVLAHCGMGMLDETEVESIGGAVTHTPEEMHAANAPVVTETPVATQPDAKAAPAKDLAADDELARCEQLRQQAIALGMTMPKTKQPPIEAPKGSSSKQIQARCKTFEDYIAANTPATPDGAPEAAADGTDDAVDAEVMDLDGTDYVEHLYGVFEESHKFGAFISKVTEKQLPWSTNGDVVAFEKAYNAQYGIDLKAQDMKEKHWAELVTLVESDDFKW